jgi:hypothetical protein
VEARDRRASLALFGLAALTWVAVTWIVLTQDPRVDPGVGFAGAGAIGLALGLTAVPLLWLFAFARQGRIAYRGDWTRAVRRGAWVGVLAGLFVVMRLQGIFQLPIGLFLAAMVLVAEVTLSNQRS